jgi:hypothetical protein
MVHTVCTERWVVRSASSDLSIAFTSLEAERFHTHTHGPGGKKTGWTVMNSIVAVGLRLKGFLNG